MRKTKPVSRRRLLKGLIALPPLEAMFNAAGTAYAATAAAPETRFVLWFNGNGIPERYWMPAEAGRDYPVTPCLSPLTPFRQDVHILSGLDNPAARMPSTGNDHHRAMSAMVTGKTFTGRGAGGPSIDQLLAARMGTSSRFRSLQIGVCQESHGDSIHRNMSWAGYDRALPPEMIPHNLFDRLFGARDLGWVKRKKSILDDVREEAKELAGEVGTEDRVRIEEHLGSIRDLERSIASLPPEYSKHVPAPEEGGDMRDYPRIAKLQSDLLVHALATGQTRVATYMLTKCQSLVRMPWLGYTALRHHDYTHTNAESPQAQRIMRDICRWHMEEFAYLLGRLKSVKEGSRTLLDNCCLLYVHEHAEANPHKNNGLIAVVAGHANNKIATGTYTKTAGTFGDLYLTVANEILGVPLDSFPTAQKKLPELVVA